MIDIYYQDAVNWRKWRQ